MMWFLSLSHKRFLYLLLDYKSMDPIQKEQIIDRIFQQDLKACQDKREVSEFIEWLAENQFRNVMEIGTDRGGLFYVLTHVTEPEGKKISLDRPQSHFCTFGWSIEERNVRLKSWGDNIHLIEGDSRSPSSERKVVEVLEGELLDLLFIDGDHSYNGCASDFLIYGKYVKEGGYICFHDISNTDHHKKLRCEVFYLWGLLMGLKREIVHNSEQYGIGIWQKTDQLFHSKLQQYVIRRPLTCRNIYR